MPGLAGLKRIGMEGAEMALDWLKTILGDTYWHGQKDSKLLRNPSCGAQNFFPLGARENFDRCAIDDSLHPAPRALRRLNPALGASGSR